MISKNSPKIAISATCLFFCANAFAQVEMNVIDDFEAASRMANSGNHEIAIEIFQQCAAEEDARCNFALGTYYYFGDGGIDIDLGEARSFLQLSADNGYGPAEYLLAIMYRDGEGVDADVQVALKYLNSAARRCVPQAQEGLAEYYEGRNTADGDLEAATWYSLAADNGSDSAIDGLGRVAEDKGDEFVAAISDARQRIESEMDCQGS